MNIQFDTIIEASLIALNSTYFLSIISIVRVYSIIFLIVTFIIVAIIAYLYSFSFIAIILVSIYAGAISISFLFIVMLIDIKKDEPLRDSTLSYFVPMIFNLFFSMLIYKGFTYLVMDLYEVVLDLSNSSDGLDDPVVADIGTQMYHIYPIDPYHHDLMVDRIMCSSDIKRVGLLLYTWYIFSFIGSGLVSLLAILGPISITSTQLKSEKAHEDILIQNLAPSRSTHASRITYK